MLINRPLQSSGCPVLCCCVSDGCYWLFLANGALWISSASTSGYHWHKRYSLRFVHDWRLPLNSVADYRMGSRYYYQCLSCLHHLSLRRCSTSSLSAVSVTAWARPTQCCYCWSARIAVRSPVACRNSDFHSVGSYFCYRRNYLQWRQALQNSY